MLYHFCYCIVDTDISVKTTPDVSVQSKTLITTSVTYQKYPWNILTHTVDAVSIRDINICPDLHSYCTTHYLGYIKITFLLLHAVLLTATCLLDPHCCLLSLLNSKQFYFLHFIRLFSKHFFSTRLFSKDDIENLCNGAERLARLDSGQDATAVRSLLSDLCT